ncbi:U3 snoRNP-associated protein-like EMB2271 [Zea mays]|uniref:U3 snoRNP-associated protein-like EMB2271 n=1 Tax=Zea mays TaxID=4577 RepID=A0A1D6KX66_MAIZE|nr:U3 snoRNP-associated protein-like EMB2271 [Zea mays]
MMVQNLLIGAVGLDTNLFLFDTLICDKFSQGEDGFVNSLAIAKSGRFIVAGVGQEPRLGRWGRVRSAQNGVAIHPIRLKDVKEDL